MGSRFISLDREKFLAAFKDAGFEQDSESFSGEIVLSRQHHLDPTMFVKIFTTLPVSSGDGRECGADAIRCVLIFKNTRTGKSGGLYKAAKVLRTGSTEAVIERTLTRARECYASGVTRVTGRVPKFK